MAPPIGKKQLKLNAVMTGMIVRDLLTGSCSAQDLAETTGLALLTVQRTMRAWRRLGVLHIASWDRDLAGRMTVRVWGLGEGKDARKPIQSRNKMNQKYRARRALRPLTNMAANDPFREVANA